MCLSGRICKYPNCHYYVKGAPNYCCAACAADAYDDERLSKEEKRMEKRRQNMIKVLKSNLNSSKTMNYTLHLDKKAKEAVITILEKEANIYERTALRDVINEALIAYASYIKEYHLN